MASSNLQIDNGVVKDDLNCVKCKSILKDACLVPCGCRLCRVCINDLMASGVEFCPGPSEECGGSPLSQFVTDYRANRNISKLPITCPNNGCVHACLLANMEEHLRVCPRKSVECPFRELGCTQDKMAVEDMSDHLHQESLSHSEILIGMINNINNEMEGSKRDIEMMKKIDENYKTEIENRNKADEINMRNIEFLKNMCLCHKDKIDILEKTVERENELLTKTDEDNKTEIEVLKERDESNRKVIEMLKCESELKNDQIKSIMDEIKSMKEQNKECTNRMATLLEEAKREIDETRNSAIAKVVEYVEEGVTAVKKDIISINQGTQSIKADIYSIQSQIKVPVEQVDARLEWLIDNFIRRDSYCFHGAVHPYKYQLASFRDTVHSLQINLRLLHDVKVETLQWPFRGTVTITVTDPNWPHRYLSITQHCQMNKPTNYKYNSSDPFVFLYSDLIAAGVNFQYNLRVTCSIALSPSISHLP